MTSSPYSTLDSLVFESDLPNPMELENNLDLWTHAQFTHQENTICSSPESIMHTPSTVTYEHLAHYLDYELPQKHKPLLPKISPNMTLEEVNRALLFTPYTPPPTKPRHQPKRDPAEEEKRKRNTAASARFRIKKKQREQTMERTVKEMTEKSASLESRVKELELEIKFLRNLLIEKKSL
ncbi:Regulatory protein cys-3 [Choanephora cucurbitarum]|uniref:Regulatory protein cys-3 n=1 Tax=Choanephora cucurbitarum TaxID=101091 RepID=A0A1C7MZZ2_9FUNG|nr:Regulatory protein cys-3 [Choanephora cucurbitarum]